MLENALRKPRLRALLLSLTAVVVSAFAFPAVGSAAELKDVSCSSATNCLAVGMDNGSQDMRRWNGTTWSAESTPVPAGAAYSELRGVTCKATTMCMAAGVWSTAANPSVLKPFIVRWNGSAWVQETLPAGVGEVSSIDCANVIKCVAVGPEAELVWTGTWSRMSPWSSPSVDLADVTCRPSTTDCWTVGRYTGMGGGGSNTYAAKVNFNGTPWVQETTPNGFAGVTKFTSASCPSTSAHRCIAVGNSIDYSNATPFSGSRNVLGVWQNVLTMPTEPVGLDETSLSAVSCVSETQCFAVGGARPGGPPTYTYDQVVLTLSGTTWTGQLMADPLGSTFLNGISCTSATACTAVGRLGGSSTAYQFDGSTWSKTL